VINRSFIFDISDGNSLYNSEEEMCRTDNANGAFEYIAELKRLLAESKSPASMKKIEAGLW